MLIKRTRFKAGSWLAALFLSLNWLSLACPAQTLIGEGTSERQPHSARVLADQSVPAGWRRYQAGVGSVSFSFISPGEPRFRLSASPELPHATHAYIFTGDSVTYGAAFLADLPGAASAWTGSGEELLFEAFIKALAENLRDSIRDERVNLAFRMSTRQTAVSLNGNEGVEFSFQLGEFQGVARIMRIGQAGICLAVLSPSAPPLAERSVFFASLRIESQPLPASNQ